MKGTKRGWKEEIGDEITLTFLNIDDLYLLVF